MRSEGRSLSSLPSRFQLALDLTYIRGLPIEHRHGRIGEFIFLSFGGVNKYSRYLHRILTYLFFYCFLV